MEAGLTDHLNFAEVPDGVQSSLKPERLSRAVGTHQDFPEVTDCEKLHTQPAMPTVLTEELKHEHAQLNHMVVPECADPAAPRPQTQTVGSQPELRRSTR